MIQSKIALCFLLAAVLPACRTTQNPAASPAANAVAQSLPLYEWNGDEVAGPTRIQISLSEQIARIYKGEQEVGWTYVATGLSSHPTPTGNFSIIEKKADKVSNKYGVIVNESGEIVDGDASPGRDRVPSGCRYIPASMPHWMRLTSFGVGMHAGPIPDPGKPASHGCIRLPHEMAEKLYSNVVVGTPVTITR